MKSLVTKRSLQDPSNVGIGAGTSQVAPTPLLPSLPGPRRVADPTRRHLTPRDNIKPEKHYTSYAVIVFFERRRPTYSGFPFWLPRSPCSTPYFLIKFSFFSVFYYPTEFCLFVYVS